MGKIPKKYTANLSRKDKKKQMYDCLVDIYYILLSDVFIPSTNSAFSKAIMGMIKGNFNMFPEILSKTIIEDI